MRIASLSRKQKIVAGVAGITLAIAGGGAAYALIKTGTQGTGSATNASTVSPVALSADAQGTVDLLGAPKVIRILASNPNTNTSVSISSIASPSISVIPGAGGDCVAGDFSAIPVLDSAPTKLGPNASGVDVGKLTVTFNDSQDRDQTGCLDAQLTFNFNA